MSEYAATVKTSRTSYSRASTVTLGSRLSSQKTPIKKRFQIDLCKRLRKVLRQYLKRHDFQDYEALIVSIRDAELLDSDISVLLSEATQCISLLNQDFRLFIEAILSIKWMHKNATIISEYQSFLLNLLSAHNYHAKLVIDKLLFNFIPENNDEWPNGIPSDEDCQKCSSIHGVINILLKVIPMCRELLRTSIQEKYPYYKRPAHTQEYYLHNLLWMLDYQPELRRDMLVLIFSRIVMLDVNALKEEIEKAEKKDVNDESMFAMDQDETFDETRVQHPVGHALDICMDKLFNYIIMECHNVDSGEVDWNKTKNLYQDIIFTFDKIILPTYNTQHVQFIIFLLCSFKTTLAEAFLNYLWKKVCTPTTPSVIRQAAVAYIASFIARAKIVPLSMLKGTLQQMAEWVTSYIAAQDDAESVNSDVRVHSVFYNVCQAIFYVVAFKHSDLVNTKKNITFLQSLNLTKIVNCRFNPLRVCQQAVVQNFAAVTRTYQLAYCYSIIEHNSRNVMPTIFLDEKGPVAMCDSLLESFFPFDPYILKRSSEKIAPFYLDYIDSVDVKINYSKPDYEEDDFLCDRESPSNKNFEKFSYGSSPGFRTKS